MNKKEKFIDKCFKLTNSNIKDKELNKILINYLTNQIENKSNLRTTDYEKGYNLLLLKLKHIKCTDLDWNFICNTMHDDFKKEINILGLNTYAEKTQKYCCSLAKHMLDQLYIYLIKEPNSISKNINNLKKYSDLFELQRFEDRESKFNHIPFINSIKSKYPLNSNIESIHQDEYERKSRGELRKFRSNINLNTTNNFLKNLLIEFIQYEKGFVMETPFHIPYLYFYYYFEESLDNNNICVITDFSTKTFSKQYEFFKGKEYLFNKVKSQYSLRRILIHLYQFIAYKISSMRIDYDIFNDSWINTEILSKSSFMDIYENKYEYVEYTRLEEYPKSDLWVLSLNNEINKSVCMSKDKNIKLDFSNFKHDIIKNQVKNYIWNGPSMLKTRCKYFVHLKEFFEFCEDYIEYNSEEDKKINIPFELIWNYRLYLEPLYENSSTIRNKFKAVKGFFNFNKDEYNIDKRTLDILIIVEEGTDGNPITVEDFKILEKEFKDIAENNRFKNGILLYYIFLLATTSNLRLGEIMALERNCIISQNKTGGIVNALRKISKGSHVEQEYDRNVIDIIELAKKHTEHLSYLADEKLKNYIFLTQSRNQIKLLGNQFSTVFLKIINENIGRLSREYNANNLRHTFINIICDGVNDGIFTIEEAKQITGDTYGVIMKNYRRKLELQDYAEVMCGITISNVDINGKIINKNEDIKDKGIVMNELGTCNKDECVGSTLCLACEHFLTTLNKMPKFEKEIEQLKDELQNTSDIYRKKEIQLELNLLGTYLLNMLKLKKIKR